MNFTEMLRSCLRRWYVLVLGVVLTVGAVLLVAQHVPPTYTRSATLVLLPGTKLMPDGGNPFLFMGGLTQARDVLVRTLDDDSVRTQVLGTNSGNDYTVAGDPTSAGPLIVLTVTTKTPGDAATLLSDLESRAPQSLQRLQDEAKAPADARISSMVLTNDTQTTMDQKRRIQMLLLVFVAGLFATVMAAGLVDGAIRRRAARRLRPRPRPVARSAATTVAAPTQEPTGGPAVPFVPPAPSAPHVPTAPPEPTVPRAPRDRQAVP